VLPVNIDPHSQEERAERDRSRDMQRGAKRQVALTKMLVRDVRRERQRADHPRCEAPPESDFIGDSGVRRYRERDTDDRVHDGKKEIARHLLHFVSNGTVIFFSDAQYCTRKVTRCSS